MSVRIVPEFLTALKSNTHFSHDQDYSISYVLRKRSLSNDEFEVMLNALSLEEVIGLKLELSGRALKNKPYGLQVWKILPHIIYTAVLRFALSATRSRADASDFLGIEKKRLRKLIRDYNLTEYFEETNGKDINSSDSGQS